MNKKTFEDCIIKLRMSFNKDLYDEGVIDFDIFDKMQKKLERKSSDEKWI